MLKAANGCSSRVGLHLMPQRTRFRQKIASCEQQQLILHRPLEMGFAVNAARRLQCSADQKYVESQKLRILMHSHCLRHCGRNCSGGNGDTGRTRRAELADTMHFPRTHFRLQQQLKRRQQMTHHLLLSQWQMLALRVQAYSLSKRTLCRQLVWVRRNVVSL